MGKGVRRDGGRENHMNKMNNDEIWRMGRELGLMEANVKVYKHIYV